MEKYFGNKCIDFIQCSICTQHQCRTSKSRFYFDGTKSYIFKGWVQQQQSEYVHTITAVANQEIVVTDVSISAQFNHDIEVIFTTSGGSEIGRYKTWNYSNYPGPGTMNANLTSGLRVPAGEDLLVTINGSGSFTFAGKYVHP